MTNIKELGSILNNSDAALSERFRSLFTLKNIGGEESIKEICNCFLDKSELLNHELAYCLGQMQDKHAIPKLSSLLNDPSVSTIVRHEAGEALAAIGSVESLPILQKHVNDPIKEVAETCELAVAKFKAPPLDKNNDCPFMSVDPAPACQCTDIPTLRKTLVNTSLPLYERYRAMFSLRNIHTDESALALGHGLRCEDSALFRHEISYVLGQMQLSSAVPDLIKSLANVTEHSMVRHESAEALGSIASKECLEVLIKYQSDPDVIVRESCEVALDMYKHETSNDFQYSVSVS